MVGCSVDMRAAVRLFYELDDIGEPLIYCAKDHLDRVEIQKAFHLLNHEVISPKKTDLTSLKADDDPPYNFLQNQRKT